MSLRFSLPASEKHAQHGSRPRRIFGRVPLRLPVRDSILCAFVTALLLTGACSSAPQRQTRVFGQGEKVQVARLTYSIVDVQIQPTLPGPDGANPRVPKERFYTVQISVSNGGNEDTPIPGLALVDDAGHVYNEVPDGSGVTRWLGMVRRVSPGQTEEGAVLFDAPAAHYKLRLTDETDADQTYSDVPLSFVHEVVSGSTAAETPLPTVPPR